LKTKPAWTGSETWTNTIGIDLVVWEENVRLEIASLAIAVVVAMGTTEVGAENARAVPVFQVDPFWPKPLPNNWILGQVSGFATDRYDRIWLVHRPASLTARERAAEQNPPEAKCCVAPRPYWCLISRAISSAIGVAAGPARSFFATAAPLQGCI
jgi:hypothetical protein